VRDLPPWGVAAAREPSSPPSLAEHAMHASIFLLNLGCPRWLYQSSSSPADVTVRSSVKQALHRLLRLEPNENRNFFSVVRQRQETCKNRDKTFLPTDQIHKASRKHMHKHGKWQLLDPLRGPYTVWVSTRQDISRFNSNKPMTPSVLMATCHCPLVCDHSPSRAACKCMDGRPTAWTEPPRPPVRPCAHAPVRRAQSAMSQDVVPSSLATPCLSQ
jgi:hypothetical protein